MIERLSAQLRLATLTATCLLGLANPAFATGTKISATAVCVDGAGVINYTSTSYTTFAPDGENSRVDIHLNGVLVASGAYVAPTNAFSGVLPAPSGASATLTATTVANWGDGNPGGQSSSIVIALPSDCGVSGTGRFTGGGFQLRVGEARVTRGLTIHCDLLLSNNLEVNWGGNRFHMLEHMETVECSDAPDIIQAPPAAPLDTLIGVGRGRYNGVEGYTIEFTLVDYGEPGGLDQAALKIYQTSNPANIVLNIPLQLLAGGNLQAHYDQPHK